MKPKVFAAAVVVLGGSVACSASNSTNTFESSGAGGAGGSGNAVGSTASGAGASSGVTVGSGGSTGTSGGVAEVYGESADVLYRLDPDTKAVTVVGGFQGCSSVIDIALDKDSKMIATTSDGIYHVDKQTAVCTLIQSGDYPNSLSFVPEGTVDPNVEALVGYLGSAYVRIDPQSGNITTIGGLTGGYVSSGDIVSVKNGKTLLTVKGPNCENSDCIVEVNPSTGDLIKNWGPLNYTDVFGLAFWAGAAYAFSNGGQLFEVTFQSSLATVPIMIPSAPPGLSFWGAGSTTHAPPTATPK